MTVSSLEDQSCAQQEIIRYLIDNPSLWDTSTSLPTDVETIETHGATVLLGNSFALKMKKAVYFDHMDYSTADKRRHFCERELKFNKKTAPELYLGIHAIRFDSQTGYNWNGPSEPAEYILKMRRFAKGSRLDEYVISNGISTQLLEQLTDAIVDFHTQAEIVENPEKAPDFYTVIEANFQQLDNFCPEILDLSDVQAFRKNLRNFVKKNSAELLSRITTGQFRRGHGDLHLQNICILDDKPTLFDAIEYQDDFALSDILYDLSFLIMDLWEKDHHLAANKIFNRYLHGMGWIKDIPQLSALRLLPFYLSMRAGIRTHVDGNRYRQSNEAALKKHFVVSTRELFESSQRYLKGSPAQLVAIGGFSGSGKSTLAANLAPFLGTSPGAVHIRSDIIRRQILNWDEFSPMEQAAYTPNISQQVYRHMIDIAGACLDAGHSVIMDAVLDRQIDRLAFDRIAQKRNIPFTGIWLDVDKSIMISRIEGRSRDASDATVEVLDNQLAKNKSEKQNWRLLDGNGTPEQTLSLSLKMLDTSSS